MADAKADAFVLVGDVRGDRTQAVVASIAAAGFDFDFAGSQIKLVVKNVYAVEVNFQEALGFANGATALVHVGLGFQKRDALGADGTFANVTLEFFAPR